MSNKKTMIRFFTIADYEEEEIWLLPNYIKCIDGSLPFANGFTIIFTVLFLLYVYLFLHCGLKLRKLKKKYSQK